MITDAESILKVCGIGSYLQIGCGDYPLVFDLLKRGADAYGLDGSKEIVDKHLQSAPGRFFQGSLINYPFKPEAFDTIIVGSDLLQFQTDVMSDAFQLLLSLTKRHLVLYFPDTDFSKPAFQMESNRLFWEKTAIAAGFRRHPREMLVNPYASLENENTGRFVFFEAIPSKAREEFPLSFLLENRDLHMDMLRESGRRSDGHVSRYVMAAAKIRPGDVVLDAACGLGYGTYVLSALSRGSKFIGVDLEPTSTAYANANFAAGNDALQFHTADVTQLQFISDHSIDTVISFETIEHLENYEIFLAEVKRVLKPDGRFIGSVPNRWCDETGEDPNPYHFHVFDWDKLYKAIGNYFIVDGCYAQTSGGGFRLWDQPRAFFPVSIHNAAVVDPEWWIITACGNPLTAKHIPYANPFVREENSDIPMHVDFARYYENPWIYRTMVQLGERLEDKEVLMSVCLHVVGLSTPGSADQGAALTIIAYQYLEANQISAVQIDPFVAAVNIFHQAYDRNNPHAHRWAISLLFVVGRLLLLYGNRQDALNIFLDCSKMDPLLFSPLLATKTISSHLYAGLILAGEQKWDDAKNELSAGVKKTEQALHADWKHATGNIENPLSFGLQELAEVADLGSQCANALEALQKQQTMPGYLWDRVQLRRFGLVEWTKSVEVENQWLRQLLMKQAQVVKPLSAPVIDEHAVIQHIASRIVSASIDIEPTHNFYIEDILPQGLYQEMLRRLPGDEAYDFINHPDAKLPDGRITRKLLDLSDETIHRFNPQDQAFWQSIKNIFASEALMNAIITKFHPALMERFGGKIPEQVIVPIFYRDFPGYFISEHTDAPYKLATMMIYLPADNSQLHLGTSFHQKEGEQFHLLKTHRFAPNSGFGFVRTDKSYHSVKQLGAHESVRNTLALIIYEKGYEYRSSTAHPEKNAYV